MLVSNLCETFKSLRDIIDQPTEPVCFQVTAGQFVMRPQNNTMRLRLDPYHEARLTERDSQAPALSDGELIITGMLADDRRGIGHPVEHRALLVLEQRALFLDHQHLRQAGCKLARNARLERPDHADLQGADAELLEARRIEPDIHIYTSTRQPWVRLPEDKPAVPEYYNARETWPAESLARFKAARG